MDVKMDVRRGENGKKKCPIQKLIVSCMIEAVRRSRRDAEHRVDTRGEYS
jgi:hypothetical protein